ncbi:NAD(P)-dependent oxidoreductase [Mycobacterium aquaticum]|uniref:Uncharacterized protein n=1 Tax=Mycobacterium aquaticum TaxID=1927124 RepID=A0A1X0A226_9MYCO|nr:NAD(P)-binding domain-containing protein [Mycobacterium aquaticum]ORA24137.1 hypothetical protein BST13_34280 [Mycobacterium aquaticum]
MTKVQQSSESNTSVTVLGLGAIGAAVARTLASAGKTVTVWNRSADKAQALAEAGATVAATPAEAIAASPITVVCLWDYQSTDDIFQQDGVAEALRGKVIAQLCTGSSEEATRQANWVEARGASFLAGGVMCFPRAIGAEDTRILYSGDPAVFQQHADLLSVIAPAQKHVGNRAGDAAPVYLALWTFYFSGLGGFLDGLSLLAAYDLTKDNIRELVAPMAAKLVDGVQDLVTRLDSGNFVGDQTNISSMASGLSFSCDQIREKGIQPRMLDSFVELLKAAEDLGRGQEDVAAAADSFVSQAASARV